MSKFNEYRQETTKDRKTIRVCFDRALLSDLEDAERELKERQTGNETAGGKMLSDAETTKLKKRVETLKSKVKEKARPFIFESIGRRRWQDLVGEHPPTDANKEEFGESIDFNPDTFPAAAISRSCIDPGMTVEEAQWFLDEFPLNVGQRVFEAALRVNREGSRDPFVDGSDETLDGVRRLKQLLDSTSPSPSS